MAPVPIVNPLPVSVRERLAELTRSIRDANPAEAAWLARTELPKLIAAIESVLAEHRLDPAGHCPVCHGRRRFWRGRPRTPCRAYLAVQLRLTEPGPAYEQPPPQVGSLRYRRHRPARHARPAPVSEP